MEWEEFDAPGVGTRMLFPMAWSLLPLTVGLILLVRRMLWPTSFLAAGIMLSLVAVWLGASKVPGRVDNATYFSICSVFLVLPAT